MIGTRLYIVADHLFLVKADETVLARMTNYEPFRTDKADVSDALFALTVIEGAPVSYIEEWRQDEEGQETICGHTEDGKSVFEYRFGGKTAGWYARRDTGMERFISADSSPSPRLTTP